MEYCVLNKQIIRTPLNPIKLNFSLLELKELFSHPAHQEALYLASSNLFDKSLEWIKNDGDQTKGNTDKIIFSLLKYALRMHNRCTPFGLFAATGTIPTVTKNIVLSKSNFFRCTKIDMNYSCSMYSLLSKEFSLRKKMKYYSNTSLYVLHDKIRYVESINNKKQYQICSIDNNPILKKIISSSMNGLTYSDLVKMVSTLADVTEEDSSIYIDELINEQILISELEPSITSKDMLKELIRLIQNFREDAKLNQLKSIVIQLEKLDTSIGNNIILYDEVIAILKELEINIDNDRIFQTNLYISSPIVTQVDNESEFQNLVTDVVNILSIISPAQSEGQYLKKFKENFSRVYGEEEIPLTLALDSESGIGYSNNTNYSSPDISEFIIPSKKEMSYEFVMDDIQVFLLRKLIYANKEREYSIELKEDEIKSIQKKESNLPNSISILYSHLGYNAEKKPMIHIKSAGALATNLLGRFGHEHEGVNEILQEITANEKSEDLIYASIIHLPENRIGNVLSRPIIRDYDIPYLAKSNLKSENQILVNDLYISIRNNRIILKSKRLNKEIIPRLDNAHNYSHNSLPIYHFLSDIQLQETKSFLNFDWGPLKNEFQFLPRVSIKNVIVSVAQWNFTKNDVKDLFLGDKIQVYENLKRWKKKWNIPDIILLCEGDNELLIDLNNQLSQDLFLYEIKGKSEILLKENLFCENEPFIVSEKGSVYSNECIITLTKKHNVVDKNSITVSKTKSQKLKRNFVIGSEWIYFKIFCGKHTSDRILREIIGPALDFLNSKKIVVSWFFIRYSDPENHLRLRINVANQSDINEVIIYLHKKTQKLYQSKLISNVLIDTYKREIERYDVNGMLLAERLFNIDSHFVVNYLIKIGQYEVINTRLLTSIQAVDDLISVLLTSLNEQINFIENMMKLYEYEFHMEKNLKKQINKKYNDIRIFFKDTSSIPINDSTVLNTLNQLLEYRKKETSLVFKEIKKKCSSGQIQTPIEELLSSYVHMFINKLFSSDQRFYELLVYEFLYRLKKMKTYTSKK